MYEKNDGDPEGGVEIVEDESKGSEEGLHGQEGQVDDQVKGPKAAGGPIEACHEVDDDVVDEDSCRRKGKVGKHVGDRVRSPTVHAVTRLPNVH
jgi:hypothetical protein